MDLAPCSCAIQVTAYKINNNTTRPKPFNHLVVDLLRNTSNNLSTPTINSTAPELMILRNPASSPLCSHHISMTNPLPFKPLKQKQEKN